MTGNWSQGIMVSLTASGNWMAGGRLLGLWVGPCARRAGSRFVWWWWWGSGRVRQVRVDGRKEGGEGSNSGEGGMRVGARMEEALGVVGEERR